MSSRTLFEPANPLGNFEAEQRSRRANRRRLTVFLSVFLLLSLVGLGYVYSRPAVYQATARLNFIPAAGQPAATDPARASEKPYSLRDEVQFLTSRTLLGEVWERLKESSVPPPGISAADPAAFLQAMLSATPLEGTNIVLLRAQGSQPAFLSAFLDHLVAVYRASLAERYKSASAGTLAEVGDEARKLEASVLGKRREVDAFRARHNIVSLEREENQVLAEVKGIGAALNAANDKLVAAEARLGALQEAEVAGQSVARAKDNPTLAALEQQVAGIRADLKEVGRQFTPQYMQIDPRVKSLRAGLADLEQQIVVQHQSSQQNALQEAREEVAGARAASAALRQQLSANQRSVQTFTSHFNEYRALQEELTHIEQLRQKAVERVAGIEAEETARMPKVEVVEAAATPQSPASPWYARDAALVLVGALLAGLLTMGIVELFNRPPRQPATVIVPQAWVPVPVGGHATASLGADPRKPLLEGAQAPALASPRSLPRELAAVELRALLDAADRDLRAAIALLLMGLTRREVVDLRRGDIDRDAGSVRVTGIVERLVALPANILALLTVAETSADERPADAPLLVKGNGPPMAEADLDAALLYAAHDAGLENADEVTPLSLRHTYVAFLVRQGMRFSELVKLVGHLPADTLAAYKLLAPAGPRQPLDRVDLLLPAIRELPHR